MKLFKNCFQKVHLHILIGFLVAFSGLTLWAMLHQSPDDWRDNMNFTATVCTFSGPFTGAIARPAEPDCLRTSIALFPYCAAFLLAGTFIQCVALPFRHGADGLRIVAWVIGLLGWFAGSVLSLMNALS